LTLSQQKSKGCSAQIRMATDPKNIDGTEKETMYHSTEVGLNQISRCPGSGPTKIDCAVRETAGKKAVRVHSKSKMSKFPDYTRILYMLSTLYFPPRLVGIAPRLMTVREWFVVVLTLTET